MGSSNHTGGGFLPSFMIIDTLCTMVVYHIQLRY
jgi:hypothetical protein